MVATDRVRFLFSDARTLYDGALEMLDQGKIRNAAEKAWGARSVPPTPWSWPGTARSRSRPGRPEPSTIVARQSAELPLVQAHTSTIVARAIGSALGAADKKPPVKPHLWDLVSRSTSSCLN